MELAQFAEVVVQIPEPVPANVVNVDAERPERLTAVTEFVVVELDLFVDLAVHELLEGGVVQVVRPDPPEFGPAAWVCLHPYEDVRLPVPSGVGEGHEVFEQLGLCVLVRPDETVLVPLEVEKLALGLGEQFLEPGCIHGDALWG